MGTNRFSAMYRFSALFGGDGKKRYIGTPLYVKRKLYLSSVVLAGRNFPYFLYVVQEYRDRLG